MSATEQSDFLSDSEIDALIEGTLDPARHAAFAVHAQSCGRCAILAADAGEFRELVANGPSLAEQSEFREHERTQARSPMQEPREIARPREAPPLAEITPTRSAPRPRRWRRRWVGLAAAASLVALLLIPRPAEPPPTGDVMISAPGLNPFKLEMLPFSPPPTVRGEAEAEALWKRVELAWIRRDWSAADLALGQIGDRDPEQIDAWVYSGISRLAQGVPKTARQALNRAREMAEQRGLPHGAASYYLGVAHLMEDDVPSAGQALREAVNQGGPFGEAADRLLAELSRLGP